MSLRALTVKQHPGDSFFERARDKMKKKIGVTFIGLENVHGLVVRVSNGTIEIDASAVPLYRQQQAAFDADTDTYEVASSARLNQEPPWDTC